MARNKSEMPRNSSGSCLTAANKTETDYLGKVQEVLVDDSGASSCFTSPANKEKAIPGTRVKLTRPRYQHHTGDTFSSSSGEKFREQNNTDVTCHEHNIDADPTTAGLRDRDVRRHTAFDTARATGARR